MSVVSLFVVCVSLGTFFCVVGGCSVCVCVVICVCFDKTDNKA